MQFDIRDDSKTPQTSILYYDTLFCQIEHVTFHIYHDEVYLLRHCLLPRVFIHVFVCLGVKARM